MTLSQFSERWLEYRTNHELRVSLYIQKLNPNKSIQKKTDDQIKEKAKNLLMEMLPEFNKEASPQIINIVKKDLAKDMNDEITR